MLYVGKQGASPLPIGMPPVGTGSKIARTMCAWNVLEVKNSLALVMKNGLAPMVKNTLRA